MAFWDADRGVAFSDSVDGRFVILLTSNGGRTWTPVPQQDLPPALAGEGAYAASGSNVAVQGSQHVWIGTTVGRVLRSSDGGRSWNVAAAPVATGPSAGIFSIAFADATRGIVVGGDYRREAEISDNAAVTVDGGRTWTARAGLTGFRSVVKYVPRAATPSLLSVGPSARTTPSTMAATGDRSRARGSTRSASRRPAASAGAWATTDVSLACSGRATSRLRNHSSCSSGVISCSVARVAPTTAASGMVRSKVASAPPACLANPRR